jgi:hypothetical protein
MKTSQWDGGPLDPVCSRCNTPYRWYVTAPSLDEMTVDLTCQCPPDQSTEEQKCSKSE